MENIKLIIFDSDGVLTDGKIIYTSDLVETRNFNARDGLGLKLLLYSDIKVAVISGKRTSTLKRRCNELGIKEVHQNVKNKLKKSELLLKKFQIQWENVAYMGDDWNDFPVIKRAAFSGIPSDGAKDMQSKVDFVSQFTGGNGAVREFIEFILKEKGIYEKILDKFLNDLENS